MEQSREPRNKPIYLWSVKLWQRKIEYDRKKGLNIWQDTVELLEENFGKVRFDVNCTSVFLSQLSKAVEIKTKINKLGLNQTYKLLHSKVNHKQNKETIYEMGENICKHCNQGLNFQNIEIAHKTQQHRIIQLKVDKNPNRHFFKDIQLASRHTTICSTSSIIREMQIKLLYQTPVRTAILKSL